MKRVVAFVVLALAPTTVWANSNLAAAVNLAHVRAIAQSATQAAKMDLINWKVGDKSSYNVEAMGQTLGTMDKYVDRNDGQTLWMVEKTSVIGQADEVDVQIDRTNGQIVKMMQNGQEVQVPTDQPQVTNQEITDITVPAGTFHCVHITFNTSQVQGAQLWANPQLVVMDGSIKQDVPTQGIDIVLELTSFAPGQ